MRILFITNQFPPLVDGVGDYTYNIAKQFAVHGHEVYVVCKQNPRINTEVNGMIILPVIKKWDFHCHQPIVGLIQEKGIEVVFLQYVPHGFHPKGLPFPIIKLVKKIKKCPVKLFTFFHEVGVEPEKGNLKRTVLSKLMLYISKKIIVYSDGVATSIDYYRKMILSLVPSLKEVPVIPIASNVPETDLTVEDIQILKKEMTPKDEIIISFFGVRNITTSIDAISELMMEGYHIRVLIIGQTSNNLPSHLPEDTIKTGILDIKEIDKYFKISDIFILPENNESGCSFKSGSLALALRNQFPILTSCGRLTPSELQNYGNICFCDFNDLYSIKNSLSLILKQIKEKRIQKYDFHPIEWMDIYHLYIDIIARHSKNNL